MYFEMEENDMKSKKVNICLLLGVLCFSAVVTAWSVCHVSIGCAGLGESYWALSVAFDKQAMKQVDCVVLHDGERLVETRDTAFITQLCGETMAAKYIATGCSKDYQIDLYSGETLVRTMYWGTCCDTGWVYPADDSHWVMNLENLDTDWGTVEFSEELVNRLHALIGK